ncbi:MAG TPA: SDR family oxidoreductase [Flavipsychrobacter sp.]|nr:SDR family oxidoreductase [Flavipsychrobacter sp.]
MSSLKDKVVVITGASSGIGKALADVALHRNAKVAVCARNIEKLKNVFGNSPDKNLIFFQADVSKEADCKAFVDFIIAEWDRIDVLINNAGTSMRALFEDANLSVIRDLIDVNFWGTVYSTKYALPSIRTNNGVVVGVSSVAGYRGLPGRTGYSASKFAMQGFLEALRTELLHTGTHIMWVCPGFTASNIRNVALNATGTQQSETPLEEDKLMTAEECAINILNAVEKRKRTIIMTGQGKLTVLINKLFPGLADKLVYKHFLKEPGSPLLKYHPTANKK